MINKVESLSMVTNKVPFCIEALDKDGRLLKKWTFGSIIELEKAFKEIYDEWWKSKTARLPTGSNRTD